jgi:urease accessory protein
VGPLVVAAPAIAHTGPPADGALDGVLHPLSGVDHLLAMVAVGVLAATTRDRRVAWLTPIGFVAGMIAGGAVGLAGPEVPVVEVAIAASVVVLGLLIGTVARDTGPWLVVVAASFGAAHGHAHGAELPAGAAPFVYTAGFVVATAALHLAGTVGGLGLRRLPIVRVAIGIAVGAVGVVLLASL